MEQASGYTRQQARPTLAADGQSMVFGGMTFYRCADGAFRENRTTRPTTRNTGGGSASNTIQRLRLELEVEAGR